MDVTPHIRRAIEVFGTQEKLAAAAGIHQSTISRILAGKIRITAEAAAKLDRATGGEVRKECLRPDVFGSSCGMEQW
jgi:DNA-binding transcriptional regulator YdaS (Cro superfamily)